MVTMYIQLCVVTFAQLSVTQSLDASINASDFQELNKN